MKKIYCIAAILSIASIAGFLFSCQKLSGDEHEALFKDGKKPLPVSNVQVKNLPGGAMLTYDLPNDPSVLYVQADYAVNSKTNQQKKVSYYVDSMLVNGFEKVGAYTVTLRTVSRGEVLSDAVTVTVNPQTPPYVSIRQTLQLFADFGGVNVAYQNPDESEVGIVTLVDTAGKAEYIYTEYTKKKEGNFSVRGFSPKTRKFGAYVRDRWGNSSDTVWANITSLNEVELSRTIMKGLYLPGDQTGCCGATLARLITNNGAVDAAQWGTPLATDSLPARITFDLGATVKLSRIRWWMRKNGTAEFINGTPKFYKIYGSNNPNPNGALDNSWVQLGGLYELVKPSGLPYGQRSAADNQVVNDGTEVVFPLPAVSMRYFRVVMLQNYAGSSAMDFAAFKFWGDPNQ
ncbi:DUF4959 domain-containing protein [Chitinophagaceae bacterium LB-8]|uniref:DUF4959 domain-containing protein n=1 Tax=Paraflavisolibacter caeni TaxID=2982496 RepID=A0A9X3BKA2_9BACT|nr:DUF5000 domain-containing lipoprotein [Paraflavisolibacter caeni]MCU7552533.1 DUF4959 domain-containing protein [Paraflavisolibacter caeni]